MRRIVSITVAALMVGAFASINAAGAVRKPPADALGRRRAGANSAPFAHWCNTNGITCTEPFGQDISRVLAPRLRSWRSGLALPFTSSTPIGQNADWFCWKKSLPLK